MVDNATPYVVIVGKKQAIKLSCPALGELPAFGPGGPAPQQQPWKQPAALRLIGTGPKGAQLGFGASRDPGSVPVPPLPLYRRKVICEHGGT